MRCLIVMAGAFLCIPGCTRNGPDVKDAGAVYEAVLKVELKDTVKGEGHFIFVDGKDPEPALLQRFQKQWPALQPGSKVPQGQANRVSIDGLQWIDAGAAELRGGSSNGMDGRVSRYRVVNKAGTWVVEKAVVEAAS
jgi:hypothetical protein